MIVVVVVVAKTVQEEGATLSSQLFKPGSREGIPDSVQAGSSSQAIEGTSQEATLNFGVHRRGVLTAFDWRNSKLLDPNNSRIDGGKFSIQVELKRLMNPTEPMTKSELEKAKKTGHVTSVQGPHYKVWPACHMLAVTAIWFFL
ncbi:hypothetical protein ACHAPO_010013 [Fusarium lateritium]